MSLLSVSVMRERGNKRERGLVSGRLEIRERGEECQQWTLDSHEDIMSLERSGGQS